MRRFLSLVACIMLIVADLCAFPVYASVQDDADAQAKDFASIWEQSGKKASDYEHTVLFETTGYQGEEAGGGGSQSATGKPLASGMIAVDPKVIPLGTEVMICGHTFIAEDTGGVIKGHIIDIWFPTIDICNQWGRQKVYVSWNGGSEPSPAGGTPATVSSLEGDSSAFKMGATTDTADTSNKKTENSSNSSITSKLKRIIYSFRGTEDDIAGLDPVVRWGGTEIQLPDGKNLTRQERLAIANWGTDIANSEKGVIINTTRACIASIGIWFIVYTLFVYLSYWLDRANNLVEIGFLSVVTFGKLSTSYDESISTYSENNKGKTKLVCHKDMMKVIIVGITIGVLLLSGTLYSAIETFLNLVKGVSGGM